MKPHGRSVLNIWPFECKVKVNVKFTLEQSIKAQRVEKSLYSSFNLGCRCVCVVNATPRPLHRRGRASVPIVQKTWVGPRAGVNGCGKCRRHRCSILRPFNPLETEINLNSVQGFISYRTVNLHSVRLMLCGKNAEICLCKYRWYSSSLWALKQGCTNTGRQVAVTPNIRGSSNLLHVTLLALWFIFFWKISAPLL